MPWHWEPMKDVTSCDKLRGGAHIPRSADFRMGKPAHAKSFAFWTIPFVVFTALFTFLGYVWFDEYWWFGLIGGAILGIIFGIILVLIMRKANKNVKFQYGASNYVRKNSFAINYRKSIYLYSKLTKTPRPQDKK